jgi:hypothetical protein
VVRRDGHTGRKRGNQYGSFVTYWADQTCFQNCISLDGLDIEVGDPSEPMESSAIFFTANGSSNYTAEGCLSVNDEGYIALFESGASPVTLRNNAVWMANKSRGVYFRKGNEVALFNNLFANAADFGIREMPEGTFLKAAQRNILMNIRGSAFDDVQGSHSDNLLFGNYRNYTASRPGKGEITNLDPSKDGLKFGNGRIGPYIINRIGVDESLWGDTNWNTETKEPLWPWKNEAIIREKMRLYAENGVHGERGFCANGVTLTKYVNKQLF